MTIYKKEAGYLSYGLYKNNDNNNNNSNNNNNNSLLISLS